MKKELTVKEALFWLTVALVPGGSLILAYRLGRDHRKIKTFFNSQLNRLRRKQ